MGQVLVAQRVADSSFPRRPSQWLYNTLPGLDLSGKKVAVFGVGDQQVRVGGTFL